MPLRLNRNVSQTAVLYLSEPLSANIGTVMLAVDLTCMHLRLTGTRAVQGAAVGLDDASQADHLGMVRRIRERVDALLRLAQLEVRTAGHSLRESGCVSVLPAACISCADDA